VTARLSTLTDAARELELDVAADSSLADLLGVVRGEQRVVVERRDRLDAELAEKTQLEETIATRAADAEVATELARLLDANHFERWLVTEALTRLVGDASVRLLELSNGRYSFVTDGRDFQVVDHTQADERRSVRTLSGGETFQASLALALALSDQLAALAPAADHRLGSIFLDEGFGSLDADTLETVAGAIENLGAGDRMVGIVTHVPELAGRMPVQYRVSRGPRGATVERVDP
jgi:exonuclease SbcC